MRRNGPAAVVSLAAALAAAGCGGSKAADAPKLAWVGTPVAYTPPNLPTDRVVLAKVRNASTEALTFQSADLVVRDASGTKIRTSGRYIAGYGHGLYGAFQQPSELPPQERTRLGLEVRLKPGATAPIALAWRLPKGVEQPLRVDYGGGSLTLPAASKPGS